MKNRLKFLLMLMLLSISMITNAQQQTLTGKVVDENNEAIIGASILIKGTTQGVLTDIDGNFTVSAQSSDIIIVSYIGYESQELPVSSNNQVHIIMQQDINNLDEVVVVGYGTIKKSDLTGAVSRVGGDDLKNIASTDVVKTMQGKVAGVNITSNSGEPGAGVKIRVRGVGSWSNSNPVYVVDGFPTSDISNIDPSNIESIEVLKDASATAIYGSRGANGVVLVTTKQGSQGKTVINISGYGGIQYTNNLLDLTDATEFATLRKEAFANENQTIPADELAILDYVIANNSKGTDWQDELINPAPIQSYTISAKGGKGGNSFNVGATAFSQEGLVDNSGMDKLFVWANNEYKLSDKVKMGANISYVTYKKFNHNSSAYSGSLPVAVRMDPITPAWDEVTDNYGVRFMSGVVITNPALAVDHSKYNTNGEHKFVGNFNIDIKDLFIEGLSIKTMFAADLKFTNSRAYYPEFWLAADQFREESQLYESRGTGYNWAWNAYANYSKTVGDHSINFMAGTEAQQFNWQDMWAQAFDVPEDENLQYLGQAINKEQKDLGGGASKTALLSYFARANYSYMGRYLMTATFRADGSSKFKGDNKWGYFPSFSAGWNVKEESFMEDISIFDQLKIRAGWGQVGNESSVGSNDYVTTMTTGYTYVIGGSVVDGAVAQKIANPDIKWETSEQINIGADFSMIDHKLSISFDYFNRITRDLILAKPIPFYVGAQRPSVNAGEMQNIGYEMSANWRDQFESGLSYNVGFNISAVSNSVTSLAGGEPFSGGNVAKLGNTTRTEEGEELAYFYGLQTDGIINTQEELDKYLETTPNSKAELGDVKFVNQNNDAIIDESDKVKLGSAFPDFTMGLNLGIDYKGFDLKASLYASVGNEIVNGQSYNIQTSGILSNYSTDRLDRWSESNIDTDQPRMTSKDPNENYRFSDRYVEDGSYLRLRNLQIGYSLSKDLLKKVRLGSFRIYCSADNLFTLTNYSGWNPEISGGGDLGAGVDYATYPVPTIITGGINITL